MTPAAKPTPRPWLQLSHKYLSIDNGQTPQVFIAATEADEALMLAAPDLVGACREAEFALDLWIQTWEANPMMRAAFPGNDPTAVPRTFDALAALRAALQKAGAAE